MISIFTQIRTEVHTKLIMIVNIFQFIIGC